MGMFVLKIGVKGWVEYKPSPLIECRNFTPYLSWNYASPGGKVKGRKEKGEEGKGIERVRKENREG